MQTVLLTDEELVALCKQQLPSDTRSYEILVQRHMHRVYSLIYRIVVNKEEAEDLSQEVFLKVYNNLKKYEQQASFTSWLYRIATNTALDALDKTKRRPVAAPPPRNQPDGSGSEPEVDPLNSLASGESSPEDQIVQTELRECIQGVLRKLDKEQARMLVLRDFDDLNYDDISKLLKLGLSAVKMRVHRARLSFQDLFNQACGQIYLTTPARKRPAGSDKANSQN